MKAAAIGVLWTMALTGTICGGIDGVVAAAAHPLVHPVHRPGKGAAPKSAPADPLAPKKGRGAAGGHGNCEVIWLGHAAFQVRTPRGALLLIDPWLTNPQAPPRYQPPDAIDAILVSHGHPDHLGEALALAASTGAKLIASQDLLEAAALPSTQKVMANIGGQVQVRDTRVVLTEAVHTSSMGEGGAKQPLAAAVGFILAIEHGPTLYHAGATDVFASMGLIRQLWRPQVAMLPIHGRFTMAPRGAALAASLLGVGTVVAMHPDAEAAWEGQLNQLQHELAAGISLRRPKPGDLMNF